MLHSSPIYRVRTNYLDIELWVRLGHLHSRLPPPCHGAAGRSKISARGPCLCKILKSFILYSYVEVHIG